MDITVSELEDEEPYHHLLVRDKAISICYGPPDLCYLVMEQTKMFGSGSNKGIYHYVYGADVSSSASVAAYINAMQNKIVDHGRVVKRKVIKGVFCIYDSFFKVDVRVEVNMPGMTVCYALVNGKKRSLKEIEWDCAFISSVLRCFHAVPCNASHKMKLLSSDKVFIEFLNSILRVYKKRFSLCVPIDISQQSSLPLFWYLTEFLKEKQRLKESLEFFETLNSDDEEFVVFVAEFLCLIGRHTEALRSIAKAIAHCPFNVSLLYKEVSILHSLLRYKDAIKVAEHLVKKAADSYQSWIELATLYLYNYQIREFILALDLCPSASNIQYVTPCTPIIECAIITKDGFSEEVKEPVDILNEVYFGPYEPDFEYISRAEVDDRPIEDQDKELKLAQRLVNAPYNCLSETERAIYNLFAKLEKLIGWHHLLSVCSCIFDLEHCDHNMLNSQICGSTEEKWAAKGYKQKAFKTIFAEIIKIDRNVLKVTDNHEQSSNESISSSPEDYNFSNHFLPIYKEEESEFDKQRLENEINQIKEHIKIKNKCHKISTILRVMHYDLILMQEWVYEANKDAPMGVTWVLRGDLASRLQRFEYAERAYLLSLKNGMSLYSLRKLMELYCPKYISACLRCMSEMSEIVQGRVMKTMKVMPDWIENNFFKLVEKVGLKCVINKLKKNELTDCYYLLNAVEKCKYWRVEGYNR